MLFAGCASEDEPPTATLSLDGTTFSLAETLRVDTGAFAVLNVQSGACAVYRGEAERAVLDGEEPLLLGLFAEGNAAVAAVDGDDPRLYVTSGAADDAVVADGDVVHAHVTFDRVVRTEWIGIDFRIVERPLSPPVVLVESFAARACP